MRLIISLLFLFLFALPAQTLSELVARALEQNPSMKALEAEKRGLNHAARKEGSWTNPVLTLGVNDLRTDDFGARDLEPMQTQAVILSQRIPMGGKTDLAGKAGEAEARTAGAVLEAAKIRLAASVRIQGVETIRRDRELAVLARYRQVAERVKGLLEGYEEAGVGRRTALVRAEAALTRVDLRMEELRRKKAMALAELSRLVSGPVDGVEGSLELSPLEPLAAYLAAAEKNNPDLAAARRGEETARTRLDAVRAGETPDVTVGVGYYQRENYEDYVSFSVSLPLQLYGAEEAATQTALARRDRAARMTEGEADRVASEVAAAYASARSEAEKARLIEEELLPRLRHVEATVQARIETGAAGAEEALAVAKELLEGELELVAATASARTWKIRLDQLTGGNHP